MIAPMACVKGSYSRDVEGIATTSRRKSTVSMTVLERKTCAHYPKLSGLAEVPSTSTTTTSTSEGVSSSPMAAVKAMAIASRATRNAKETAVASSNSQRRPHTRSFLIPSSLQSCVHPPSPPNKIHTLLSVVWVWTLALVTSAFLGTITTFRKANACPSHTPAVAETRIISTPPNNARASVPNLEWVAQFEAATTSVHTVTRTTPVRVPLAAVGNLVAMSSVQPTPFAKSRRCPAANMLALVLLDWNDQEHVLR